MAKPVKAKRKTKGVAYCYVALMGRLATPRRAVVGLGETAEEACAALEKVRPAGMLPFVPKQCQKVTIVEGWGRKRKANFHLKP